jgi:hypothetical protein
MDLIKHTFTNGAIAAVSTSSLWLTPEFYGWTFHQFRRPTITNDLTNLKTITIVEHPDWGSTQVL